MLNLVFGGGREVGDTIVRHPAILAVSFTGSNDVGTGLYGAAAARGIKCQCEMGGKNPIVVLADADLDLAVESTVQGAFGSTGQRCTATSRAVVVESIADEFVERLAARTAALVVGNGLDPTTHVGPVGRRAASWRRCSTTSRSASTKGRRLVRGGERISDNGRDRGYFVAPAIFDHVEREDAHRAGGDLRSGAVADSRAGHRSGARSRQRRAVRPVCVRLHQRRGVDVPVRRPPRAGIIHVNSPTVGGEAHIPFGGMKATGVGLREMGRVAIDFYTELKVVYVDYTGGVRKTQPVLNCQ